MITLIRWISLKQKEVKYKLAFYSMIETVLKEQKDIIKTVTNVYNSLKDSTGEELQNKLISTIAEMAHAQAVKERETEKNKDN